MAEWIQSLPPEHLPSELHLSHNKIAHSGFGVLVDAIDARLASQQGDLPWQVQALPSAQSLIIGLTPPHARGSPD